MRIYPEQLNNHLQRALPSCCLIFGDEALLSIEALEQIQQCAKLQGFLEKFSYSLDGNFDKDQIFSQFNTLSLFSEKQIIELTLSKTTKENTDFIREITPLLNPDIILILKGPKLNNQQLKSVWFNKLEQQGLFISTNALLPQRFPQWLSQRLKFVELSATTEVIDFLALHFEGNLLAAKQEIEKLSILFPKQHLQLQQVEQSITTHNHFSLFQWVDSLLAGDRDRNARIIKQLHAEGTELLLLSATLNSEIQKLLTFSYQLNNQSLTALFNQQKPKLWPAKQALITNALKRLNTQKLENMLIDCAQLEVSVKVENKTDTWLQLDAICYQFLR
ncbi:DNA polymerase III subunit delta [Psychromonas sp. RZ22]|uniref:DNA polymerase III subunit delta n=1 Tax=Psychromonas algarum TaxID=2555643 RepID=UPI0010677535|nr:DNA polymerase III subunit delta [Psychromonas sp. RZ22]TEW54859.1 DNA polymerase III subunit delta [Psychromonas sp. RZ22]